MAGIYILSPDHKSKMLEPERQKFISGLHERELIAEELVDSLLSYAEREQINDFANNNNFRPDKLFERYGIVLYVYSGRNLIYWTNNSIAIPDGTLWYKQAFVHTGNAYVIPHYKTNKKQTAVSIITVKSEYQYENEFLKNAIHPSFNIQSDFDVTTDDAQSENAIYSTDGNYLFTFSLENTDNATIKRRVAFPFLLLAILMLLLYAQKGIKRNRLSNRKFFIITIITLATRAAIQILLPEEFYSQLSIFSPKLFAASPIFPSIGDLLISVVLVFYLLFVYFFKVHLKRLDKFPTASRIAISAVWIAALTGYFLFINYVTGILINDSNFTFEMYEITNISTISVLSHLILTLCFSGFILLLDKAAIQMLKTFSYWKLVCIELPIVVIAALIDMKWHLSPTLPQNCLTFCIITLLWFKLREMKRVNFAAMAVVVGIFAIYLTDLTRTGCQKRQDEECEVMCVNLSQLQDPAAEVVLADAIADMKNDNDIAEILNEPEPDYDYLGRYIQNQYFIGYLNRYVFELNVCAPNETSTNCSQFYNRYLRQYGVQTQVSGLYRIKDASSEAIYMARVSLPMKNGKTVTLYFSLSPKFNYEVLGYPELLLEKPLQTDKYKQHISYAKYQNGHLTTHSGSFPYAFDSHVYGEQGDDEFRHFRMERYDHVMFYSDSENCIIVSTPAITAFDILISFTYTFVFFLIITTILLVLGNQYTRMFDIRFTIKNKVLISILTVLLISSVSVAGGVVYYTINHYKRSQNDIMASKLQSVLIEIEQQYSDISDIKKIPANELNNLLTSFSNTFLTDINLYSQNGDLIASSRREIYSRKLTSRKMNPRAYRELEMNRKSRLVQKENIGGLSYYSAYVPFINSRNKLLAYINLPYFIKQTPLRQELTSVSVAVINIYVVLVMLSVAIAILLSKRITKPIIDVQERIRSIDLGKSNQRVEYEGDDEIAELVNEYNLMLDELSISATRLAKSERESAWREMARQVAHEIKNPLTPMKLSVQLLERSQRNGDPDFNERFENTARTLIEQIDSLSSIASEFSQFARMPEGRTELVNLNERINQSVELFRDTTNTKINFTEPAGLQVFILADNERMLQVFNNLIKNAIQAIPKKQKGRINISLRCFKGRAVVEIQDNGTGISPETESKLFQPNFTTKTSGTGLGLAIVKNIVEDAGGAIWFYSKVGKGTSFFVSFPLPQNEQTT
ncbi:MAG: GHKL domain-containing protein [Salinivirgaceae bacterium]|nr:GHKL domain-containing protein [Salinivirgaceae bacterium]